MARENERDHKRDKDHVDDNAGKRERGHAVPRGVKARHAQMRRQIPSAVGQPRAGKVPERKARERKVSERSAEEKRRREQRRERKTWEPAPAAAAADAEKEAPAKREHGDKDHRHQDARHVVVVVLAERARRAEDPEGKNRHALQ
eukprot:Amastigsp_a2397_7.p3 type:complete len:145 gc:universal Amastigsp_a2397_7:789-1223(+)